MNNPNTPNPDYFNKVSQFEAKPNHVFIDDILYVRGDDGVLRTEDGKALQLGSEVKPDGE